jgi:hypothetical protein
MENEFLKLWSKLEEIAERARREARGVAIKVCNVIKERYWDRIKAVAEKYGLDPKLGIEINGSDPISYVPVLYLVSEEPLASEVIESLKENIHRELGEWISDARLHVVLLTRDAKRLLNLELINNNEKKGGEGDGS